MAEHPLPIPFPWGKSRHSSAGGAWGHLLGHAVTRTRATPTSTPQQLSQLAPAAIRALHTPWRSNWGAINPQERGIPSPQHPQLPLSRSPRARGAPGPATPPAGTVPATCPVSPVGLPALPLPGEEKPARDGGSRAIKASSPPGWDGTELPAGRGQGRTRCRRDPAGGCSGACCSWPSPGAPLLSPGQPRLCRGSQGPCGPHGVVPSFFFPGGWSGG